MMFNNIFSLIQSKFKFLYENSLFLQNIDNFILLTIVLVFISSIFLESDYIGFIAIVTVFLTVLKFLTKPNEKISFNTFEVFLIAYFMVVIISLAGSTLFALSLKGFLKTFIYIGFYFSVAQYLKFNTNKIPLLVSVIALCVGFESVVAILQNFAHVEEISTWQDVSQLNPEQVMTRVYGTLKPFNPNLLGGYFVSTIPAALAILVYNLTEMKFKTTAVATVITFFSVIAIFLTGCRGAYLAFMAMLFLIFLLSAKFFWVEFKKVYLSFLSLVLGFFTLAFCSFSSLRARIISIFAMRNDSSNSFRFNVYQSSLEMFRDNWLVGIGVGNKNFREIYGLYMKTGFDALSAYNVFLEIAVESGIFALIAFVGFLFVCIKDAIKIVLNSIDVEKTIFVSMALISIISIMFHGFVDTIFFRPQVQFVFWFMVAVISAYSFKPINNLNK